MNSIENVYDRISIALSKLNSYSSEIEISTEISALAHILDKSGKIKYISMDRLYKYLEDDFDTHRRDIEQRLKDVQVQMLDRLSEEDKKQIFGPALELFETLSTYEFLYLLAKHVSTIW